MKDKVYVNKNTAVDDVYGVIMSGSDGNRRVEHGVMFTAAKGVDDAENTVSRFFKGRVEYNANKVKREKK